MMTWFFTKLWIQITSPLTAALGITGLIGVGCIAAAILLPAWIPFSRKNLLIAGAVAIASGLGYWYIFHAGEQHAYQLIAAKDRLAVERVEVKKKEVLDCNGGLDWDVTTGSCNPK